MKKALILPLALLLALTALTGCKKAPAASTTVTVSEPAPSQEPVSEPAPVSEETPSEITSSEITSSEVTSSEETPSQPDVPVTPAADGFDTTAAARLTAAANAQRSAAGLPAMTENARLTAAAQEYISRLSAAGIGFINTTDFKTLPDGSKVTSLVNGISMDAPKMSGINYSVWINQAAGKSNTVEALLADAVASQQYASKVTGAYNYIGSAAYSAVSDGVTQYSVIVVYYAADSY